jgi:hypothetical protein
MSEAWHAYCDTLRAAGDHLLGSNADATPTTRAEGLRYLLGLVRAGIGQAIELADPARPRFFRNPDSASRWGAENADNQYLWARVDPGLRYAIHGERGSVFDFLIEVKEGYMQLGDARNFATLTADEIRCDADGRFCITLASDPPRENGLALDPDARYIAIRQYFCDWEHEQPARFTIECLDGDAASAAITPGEMASLLRDAGAWTETTARFWTQWTEQLRESWSPSQIAAARKFAGGADDIYYGNDYFRLGSEEALLIETQLPNARYWQFQLCDLWFRSADWSERSTSLNQVQAHIDEDGRFRCVVSHRDPGIANWLDTAGEPEGVLQYRWIWSSNNPQPTGRIVPFGEVRQALPADTPAFSPSDRQADRRMRRRHRSEREPAS